MGNILDDWFGIEPPKLPKVPAAQDTATAQAKYNLDALHTNISANRLDQTTPFSSIKYNQTGVDAYGNPTYGVTTSYSPEQQALLNLLQSSQAGLGTFGQNLISNLFKSPIYGGGEVPDFTSMANPLMERQLAFMNPYYEQQFNKLDNDLRNQGFTPGTPAYDNAIRTLRQTQNESMGQFANQSIQSVMAQYEQPLNMIRAIMGSTGPVNMPNLGVQAPPSASINPVNYQGITSDAINAQLKEYEAQYKQYADSVNAIGSIMGTVLGAPSGTFIGNAVGGVGSGLAGMLGIPTTGSTGGVLPLFRSPTTPRPA